MAAAAGTAKVLTSFLAAAGGAAKAAAPTAAAVGSAAGGVASVASALKSSDGPRSVSTPEPDSKLARADKQRRLAAQYADQGRVGSVFGKDKLG
ncbi:MAG: hypothetical protein AAFZ74_02085 [Pseudomonadota bacterium]